MRVLCCVLVVTLFATSCCGNDFSCWDRLKREGKLDLLIHVDDDTGVDFTALCPKLRELVDCLDQLLRKRLFPKIEAEETATFRHQIQQYLIEYCSEHKLGSSNTDGIDIIREGETRRELSCFEKIKEKWGLPLPVNNQGYTSLTTLCQVAKEADDCVTLVLEDDHVLTPQEKKLWRNYGKDYKTFLTKYCFGSPPAKYEGNPRSSSRSKHPSDNLGRSNAGLAVKPNNFTQLILLFTALCIMNWLKF